MVNIKDYCTLSEYLLEESANDEHLEIKILDPNEFIKKNPSTKQITTAMFFDRLGSPHPEGLLSNQIFGLTKEERSGIFGYIDLHADFINPLIYKKLCRLDRKFKDVVHGTKTFSINSKGELVEDENGKTGLKWLKSNFDNIKIKVNNSNTRKKHSQFIKENRKLIFMNKLIVIPAYYRDVNTEQKGKVSVGEINEIYANIITNANGIMDTADYGIDITDSIKGRIQEGILAVYDWICGNANNLLEGSTGLSKKTGIIRRAGMSKTTDYGARLVLSAPNMKVETIEDVMVDMTHSAVPLAALLGNFLPFVIFQVKRLIDNNFGNECPIYHYKTKKIEYVRIDDIQMQFTEDRIKKEIDNFIHGYSNRLKPFEIEVNGTPRTVKFTGSFTDPNSVEKKLSNDDNSNIQDFSNITDSALDRVVTWCDIFFIAMNEVITDKCVIITRYPIDSMYNQFPSEVVVSSMKETEPIYYNGKLYSYYPKIRATDIGANTSNKFIDTLRLSNLLLAAIGGDYDGDQVTCKGVFTKEANEECIQYMYSKANYIGMDGKCIRESSHEAVQSLYSMTLVLSADKKRLTAPQF